jgi:TRAP-type mannitol/chloroaromatic compound transport system substrate-binding protein
MFRNTVMAAVIGIALLIMPGTTKADELWNMATAWGGGPFLEEDAKGFAKTVAMLTDGRIQINVFPGGTLGKALKVSDTVRSNVVQAGHTWMGYDWGIDKTTVLFANMAGGLNPEELIIWLYQAGGAELWFEYRMETFGVASIPCGIFPTEIFLHSKKRIETLDDFAGLKMRTAGAWAEIAGELGASTVILPGAEVYPALERGVIDATEWSSPSVNLPSGFHKIAKYIIMPGVHQPGATEECVFNLDAWNGISERDRELLKLAGKLMVLETWARYAYNDIAALEDMQQAGNEVVLLDAEFKRAAAAAADAWADKQAADNAWFKRVLDHRRQFQADMENWPKFRFPIGRHWNSE